MPCVLQHFVSILCYSQWVLHVHVQNSGKKNRMEARTMLGSCCIHDRPDIDTFLAYLDMYTDSLYTYVHIYIYMWSMIYNTHITCTYIYTQPRIWHKIITCLRSHQNVICRPTPGPKHISDVTSQHVLHHITTSLQPHPRPNPICGVTSQHVLHHITTSLQPHPRPNPICGYLWRKITDGVGSGVGLQWRCDVM